MSIEDRFKKKHDNNNALPKKEEPVIPNRPLTPNELKKKKELELLEKKKQEKIEQDRIDAENRKEQARLKAENDKKERIVQEKLFNFMGNLGQKYFKEDGSLRPEVAVRLKETNDGRVLAVFGVEFSIDREEMSKIIDFGKGN